MALGRDQGGPMNIFLGTQQIVKVIYVTGALAEETLWTQPIITITSDVDGGLLSEIAAWVDEIPIIGPFIGAGVAWVGSLIQFLIPDIAAILGTVTNVMRSEGTTATDDCYVEVVVGSIGYKGLITDVLIHYSEDGTGNQGVGFRLMDSTLAIVQRSNIGLGASTAVVEGCGLYQIGDVLRMESYGELHVHTLLKNGQVVGIFDDLGGLTMGTGHRAVALSMQGEVATQGGARSTSPSFASLIAGDLQTVLTPASGGSGLAVGVDAPTIVGGDDPFVLGDNSAQPGGAGLGVGADHTWSVVLPGWLTWLDSWQG